jgi:hypothetical protein
MVWSALDIGCKQSRVVPTLKSTSPEVNKKPCLSSTEKKKTYVMLASTSTKYEINKMEKKTLSGLVAKYTTSHLLAFYASKYSSLMLFLCKVNS